MGLLVPAFSPFSPRTPCWSVAVFFVLASAMAARGVEEIRSSPDLDRVPTLSAMAEAIGREETRVAIGGVATRAECTGPRGPFTTEIVSGDRATRFVQVRGATRTELLLKDGTPFARDVGSGLMREAPRAVADLVRGHDVHRMLLRLDRWFVPAGEPTDDGCVSVEGPLGPARICRAAADMLPSRIDLVFTTDTGTSDVTIRFGDWRVVHGLRLPFVVTYEQNGDRFTHRIRSLGPLTAPPPGALPTDPTALFDFLGRSFR